MSSLKLVEGIDENPNNKNASEGISGPVEKAVQKFSNHPRILEIKGHYQNAGPFVFKRLPLMQLTRRLGIQILTKLQHTKISHLKFLNLILMHAWSF